MSIGTIIGCVVLFWFIGWLVWNAFFKRGRDDDDQPNQWP